jgi:transposase InsO family protein
MEVSVSGYYAWVKRPESERKRQNQQLLERIKRIHKQSRQTYGSPRVYVDLKKQGAVCSQNRVARLMQLNQIAARRKRKFVVTTDSKHDLPVAENKLDQDFTATKPNQKWVTDITYIWTKEGWLYLAVVLDLYSRKVVGWAMDENMERGLVMSALGMALLARRPPQGLLHHSDRGSQYASNDYQKLLDDNKITCSMSRKGNCYDNAVMESFFATLKQERVYHQLYQSRQQARQDIFEYIQVWYNRKRTHSTLGYISPEEFENNIRQCPMAA